MSVAPEPLQAVRRKHRGLRGPVPQSIARRYADLGGVIHYGAGVQEILVQDGRAIGVRLSDGTEHLGDDVISAADGHVAGLPTTATDGRIVIRELCSQDGKELRTTVPGEDAPAGSAVA